MQVTITSLYSSGHVADPMFFLKFQVMKCADAGADIVRITVQGKKEAEACCEIREQLFKLK